MYLRPILPDTLHSIVFCCKKQIRDVVKRYPNDLSESQFNEIKELIPKALKGDRGRSVDIKKVLDGIFYIHIG